MGTFFDVSRRNQMMQQPEIRVPTQTAGNAMFPQQQPVAPDNRMAQLGAMQNFGGAYTPAAGGLTEAAAPVNNAMTMRLNPNYLPEQWDYTQSPEYQQRLAWAQRDLDRQLLSMGRRYSTGGISAMARQQAEIAGQEIDKQYQRALQANMENNNRMFGSNIENYGRTRSEDQTGWQRAWDVTGRDWSQNYQLANLGYDATRTGVNAGNQTGANLAELLSSNGATQASLALSSGAVSADTISRLLNSGFGLDEIESLFGGRGVTIPSAVNVPQEPASAVGRTSRLPTGQTDFLRDYFA